MIVDHQFESAAIGTDDYSYRIHPGQAEIHFTSYISVTKQRNHAPNYRVSFADLIVFIT